MLETAEVFSKMPDGLDKSAMAMKVFGKSGQDMIPFLNRGAAGVEVLLNQADQLGLTLTNETLVANDALAIGLKRLELGFKGVQTMIGTAVLPVLANLVEELNNAATRVIAFIKPFAPMLAPILAAVAAIGSLVGGAAALSAVLAPLAPALGAIAGVIGPLIAPILLIGAALGALAVAWQTNFGDIQRIIPVIQSLWANLVTLAETITTKVAPLVELVMSNIRLLAGALAGFLAGDFTAAMTSLGGLAQNFITAWSTIIPDLAKEIASWAPVVLKKLGELVTDVLAWIVKKAPELADQFEFWSVVAYLWVDNAVRELMPRLAALMTDLTNWVTAQLPGLEDNLNQWVTPFVDWVLKVLAPLIQQLELMLLQALKWVVEQAPLIASTLGAWAAEFVKWVAPLIPPLLAALGALLLELTKWAATTAAEAMIGIGKNLALNIARGFGMAAGAIWDAITDVVSRLRVTLPGGVVVYGGATVEGRAAGGAVMGGQSYLVGERGPELFTPNRSGNIVPNGALGGAMSIDYNRLAAAMANVQVPVYLDGAKVAEGLRGPQGEIQRRASVPTGSRF